MSFYDDAREDADDLLIEYGQAGTIRRADGTEHGVVFALVNYNPIDRAGGLIALTDKRALLSAVGLGFEPEANEDLLIVQGVPHSIKDAIPINPAGTVVLWELRVRR